MTPNDPWDMAKDDIEKFQRMRQSNRNWGLAGIVEAVFGVLFALLALAWFVSMFFVPELLTGRMWLGMGGLSLVMFGLPFGVLYWARRGGAGVAMQVIRGLVS